jgi:hypothetical protein
MRALLYSVNYRCEKWRVGHLKFPKDLGKKSKRGKREKKKERESN